MPEPVPRRSARFAAYETSTDREIPGSDWRHELAWATWYGLGSRPELFDYPFVVLWLLPAGGICGGWLAEKAQNRRLSCFFALFPLLFLGLLFGWYYLLPVEWR